MSSPLIERLPMRMTSSEVCDLARFSKGTLWRRIKLGLMPQYIDRGRECLFSRDAVLTALDLSPVEAPPTNDPEVTADALRSYRSRQVRHAPN